MASKRIPPNIDDIPDTELYSPSDLVPVLRMHIDTIRELMSDNRLPQTKVGHKYFMSGYQLKLLLKGQ